MFSGGNRIQHDHHFVVLKRLDFPVGNLLNPDGIKLICNIYGDDFFPVEKFEQYGKRRFFPRQRLIIVFIDQNSPSSFSTRYLRQ